MYNLGRRDKLTNLIPPPTHSDDGMNYETYFFLCDSNDSEKRDCNYSQTASRDYKMFESVCKSAFQLTDMVFHGSTYAFTHADIIFVLFILKNFVHWSNDFVFEF